MSTLTITREAVLAGSRERKDYLAGVKSFFSAIASVAEPYFANGRLDYLEASYRSGLTVNDKTVMDADLMGITSQ